MKSILDPTFKYTDAAHTNIRKTFARIRNEATAAEKAAKLQAQKEQDRVRILRPINARKGVTNK